MKLFNKYSIKYKLIIIILGITISILFLGFMINVWEKTISYRKDLQTNADMNAELISEYCVAPLSFGFKTEAELVIQKLQALPNVVNACIWDKDNNIFAAFHRSEKEKISFPSPKGKTSYFNDTYLHIYHPIKFEGDLYGTVYLRITTEAIYEKIITNLITTVPLLIFLMFLTYFLANKFQSIVSEPILDLANATKVVADSADYSVRVSPSGDDEVSELYQRFNQMLSVIQNRSLERDKALAEIENLNEQLEEKVKERTQEIRKLSVAIEQSPVSVLITDVNGNIEYVNPHFTELTGYSPDEVIGKNHQLIKAGELPKKKYNELWKTITSGKSWKGDLLNKKKNGKVYWELASISPIVNEDKKISHYLMISEDITTRIQYEEMLGKAKKDAETANQAKSVFLANMSHELRTPLNAILGFTQIIRKDQTLSDIHKKNLSTIQRSGEHLRELINDVLEMSKIEAGRVQLNIRTFNFIALLNDIEAMFKVKTDVKNLALDFNINSDVPHYLKTDDGKLRQILINLLGNAVKFTEKGAITLNAFAYDLKDDNVNIVIEVVDTGIGIPDEEKEKVFEYFEQVKKIVKSEGTGLGLSISKEFAKLLNGDIYVESTLGSGSTFTLNFNTIKSVKENIEIKESVQEVVSISKTISEFKVLIVDDRASNRDLLTQMLELIGCTTKEATNGVEAIEIFNSWNPDIILMDMIMPIMDGFEAIRKIRELTRGKSVPIIAVTASVMENQTDEVMQSGASDIIRKPINENELFDKIKQHANLEYEYRENTQAKTDLLGKIEIAELIKNLTKLNDDVKAEIIKDIKMGHKKKLIETFNHLELGERNLVIYLKELAMKYDFESLLKLFEEANK